jgi:hypothetical protein
MRVLQRHHISPDYRIVQLATHLPSIIYVGHGMFDDLNRVSKPDTYLDRGQTHLSFPVIPSEASL